MNDKEVARFISLVKGANWDTLRMSRVNCHMTDVSSIVVAQREGALMRAFLAWPGHSLWQNSISDSHKLALGIHNHRYPISLYGICGRPINVIYAFGSDFALDMYRFTSAINGKGETVHMGKVYVDKVAAKPIESKLQVMSAEQLHTVFVPQAQKAAWWVKEGKHKRDTTTLLTNNRVDISGLYGTFSSKDEVVSHVEAFFKDKIDLKGIPKL